MINYLKLGRNLSKYAPRVIPKEKQFTYDVKGIYDLKQARPDVAEIVNETFSDVASPVLELSVKCGNRENGIIAIKDRTEELSRDTFVLKKGEKTEDFLPETDGCVKKLVFDKKGIDEIIASAKDFRKSLPKLVKGLSNPQLEIIIGEKRDFSICKIILKDGIKNVLNGFYTKSKINDVMNEKIHFTAENYMVTGFGDIRVHLGKITERLNDKLKKRLWLLDDRAKNMVKMRCGVDGSPKKLHKIAKACGVTEARVMGIVRDSKKLMEEADTYVQELGRDLDELGGIFSDKERYDLYHKKSSYDINMAKEKLILRQQRYKK